MKRDPGTDPVFDDSKAIYTDFAAARPPATVAQQLEDLRLLVEALPDEHDRRDMGAALRSVEAYRRSLASRLDERTRVLVDYALAAATRLGAAHQRLFARPPLMREKMKQKRGGSAPKRDQETERHRLEALRIAKGYRGTPSGLVSTILRAFTRLEYASKRTKAAYTEQAIRKWLSEDRRNGA